MTQLEKYELIINSIVCGMILYPAFYHFALYYNGKKIKNNNSIAISNLLFSVFCFSVSASVFSESLILSRLFRSSFIEKVEGLISVVAVILLLFSFMNWVLNIIDYKKNKRRQITINAMSAIIITVGLSEILVIILLRDYDIFIDSYLKYYLYFYLAFICILSFIIFKSILFEKKYKIKIIKYLFVAFLMGAGNSVLASLFYVFELNRYFINNYILVGLGTLTLSYALSLKTNEENIKMLSLEIKNDIFGVVSHELKTPLSLIVNYLSQAKQEDRLIELVSDEFKKLLKRFKDILYFDALNSDYYSYNNESALDIVSFTKKKLEVSRPTADKRNLLIELDIESENSLFAKVNSQAFDMILNNLLENALKYSSESSKIVVKLYSSDDKVYLSITNSTFNILPDDLDSRVFKRFEQHERRVDGSVGLGLYTTKNIIEKIEGAAIELTARGEKSFEVKVSFEKGVVKPTDNNDYEVKPVDITVEPEVQLTPEPKYNDRKQTILIVEDNHKIINMLVDYFKQDFNVCYATNGSSGIDRIADIPEIALIISDVMMPKIDGMTFFRMVRKVKGFEHIPFIFHTAKTDEISKVTALDLGAIDYIDKTSNPEELQFKVRNLLKNYELREKLIRYEFAQLFQKKDVNNKYKEFGISERELEIVSLVVEFTDKKYAEIGKMFGISKSTVSTHVYNVAKKIGAPTHREDFTEAFNKIE